MHNQDDFDGESFDAFGDVINRTNGIFGEALVENDSVRTATTREGLAIEFYCQTCGQPLRLIIEWPEVICLKYGVDPSRAINSPTRWFWKNDENAWASDLRCGKCNGGTGIRIKASEPARAIEDARRRRLIDPMMERQLSAQVAQIAQQIRAQQAQQQRR